MWLYRLRLGELDKNVEKKSFIHPSPLFWVMVSLIDTCVFIQNNDKSNSWHLSSDSTNNLITTIILIEDKMKVFFFFWGGETLNWCVFLNIEVLFNFLFLPKTKDFLLFHFFFNNWCVKIILVLLSKNIGEIE